ncbi:MAG TPA: 2-succinyl-6-hydroxy-2,4-cyclohexadiene-1-carboxylate synthase [bacterium]|nr:2-succinyl-6-hydroxy-2,4-cyclohexadiene-1-carboxylate synthase [bacterium]
MARILVNGVRLHVETEGSGPPLVLLHGFTGSAEAWHPHLSVFAAQRRVLVPDLLGHARSDAPADPRRYQIEHAAADLLAVFDHFGVDRPCVLGYSMGGRVALYLAATAPRRVGALILVSASPGIRDDATRRARAVEDGALADAIERDGVPAFVGRWERHPLFATQERLPAAVRRTVRAQRLRHQARGLANSLRGIGQGAQPALHEHLSRLRLPTLLMVGELDERYCALGRELCALIPGAQLTVVPQAGHAVQVEQPEEFQRHVFEFLERLRDRAHDEVSHDGDRMAEGPGLQRHSL